MSLNIHSSSATADSVTFVPHLKNREMRPQFAFPLAPFV
jgi:hypothetical protein